MGNQSSQTLSNYVSNNSVYSQSIKSVLDLSNATNISSTSIQSFTLKNGSAAECCLSSTPTPPQTTTATSGDAIVPAPSPYPGCMSIIPTISCGTVKIGQTITQKTSVVQNISSEFIQKIATNLQNSANTAIDDKLAQTDEADIKRLFNTTKQDLSTKVKNSVKTTLSTENITKIANTVTANTFNQQTQTITNCGLITGDQCDFGQEIHLAIVVNNILTAIGQMLQDTTVVNDFYTKLTQDVKQEQKATGFAGLLASIGDFITKFGTTALIVGGVIVGLSALMVGVGLIAFIIKIFRGKSTPTTTAYPPFPISEPYGFVHNPYPLPQSNPPSVPPTLPNQ